MEVSPSDESDFEDEFVSEGRLVIVPPSNLEGRETDEDSGEEIEVHPNHLNKNQLLLIANVELNNSHGDVSVGITDSLVNKPTKKMINKIKRKAKNQNWYDPKLYVCCCLTCLGNMNILHIFQF